ncbi:hypothetical protein ABGB10_17330 [Micromonospora sp. B9E7]
MWELLLFHKIAVTVQAAFVIDVPNADRTLIADGFVSLTTIVAHVLCRAGGTPGGAPRWDRTTTGDPRGPGPARLDSRRSRQPVLIEGLVAQAPPDGVEDSVADGHGHV